MLVSDDRYLRKYIATPRPALLVISDHVKDLSHRNYPLLVDLFIIGHWF